jgi:hypothetical protein
VPNGGGAGGSVTVVNPGDTPLAGHLTVFTDQTGVAPAELAFQVPARDTYVADLPQVQAQGTYLSALVEIAGGGGYVEQNAHTSDGDAVSACSNDTSSSWYLADNYTSSGSTEDLVITNPFAVDAVVDIAVASSSGVRSPNRLQGIPIPGHSIVVINQGPLPKQEAVLAISVIASPGRVVVARAQHYQGERTGFTMMLGVPSLSPEWWFADGETGGAAVRERYSIYNPTDSDVTVTTGFYGGSNVTRTDTVTAGNVLSFTTDNLGLPAGRHGAFFSTQSDAGIVVEQAITRKAGDGFVTTVVTGAPHEFTGYSRWSMAIGSRQAVDSVLVVMNLDGVAGTATVKALGPGGEVTIPGLELLQLPAAGIVTVALPNLAAALGHPLVVESTNRIIVQRLLPRGDILRGRSASLALPG